MMKKSLVACLLIHLFLSPVLFAQDPKDLRSRFFRDNEALKGFFKDDFLKRMDSMLDQSMNDEAFKEIQKAFEKDPFFTDSFPLQEGKWIEEKEGMVYLLEGKPVEGGKFDIKVKDGQVTVEADIERKFGQYGKTRSVFKQSFPVPMNCDGEKMRIEERDGKMALIFPFSRPQI